MKDYYYILGIPQDSTQREIKKAYRKLSFKFHPDYNDGDKFFEERFKEIKEAYETLNDTDLRKKYDKIYKKNDNSGRGKVNRKPTINKFSVSKTTVKIGEEVMVTWDTSDVNNVTINLFGQVPAKGSRKINFNSVSPKLMILLEASNTFSTVRKEIELQVIKPNSKKQTTSKNPERFNKNIIYIIIILLFSTYIYVSNTLGLSEGGKESRLIDNNNSINPNITYLDLSSYDNCASDSLKYRYLTFDEFLNKCTSWKDGEGKIFKVGQSKILVIQAAESQGLGGNLITFWKNSNENIFTYIDSYHGFASLERYPIKFNNTIHYYFSPGATWFYSPPECLGKNIDTYLFIDNNKLKYEVKGDYDASLKCFYNTANQIEIPDLSRSVSLGSDFFYDSGERKLIINHLVDLFLLNNNVDDTFNVYNSQFSEFQKKGKVWDDAVEIYQSQMKDFGLNRLKTKKLNSSEEYVLKYEYLRYNL